MSDQDRGKGCLYASSLAQYLRSEVFWEFLKMCGVKVEIEGECGDKKGFFIRHWTNDTTELWAVYDPVKRGDRGFGIVRVLVSRGSASNRLTAVSVVWCANAPSCLNQEAIVDALDFDEDDSDGVGSRTITRVGETVRSHKGSQRSRYEAACEALGALELVISIVESMKQ